MKTCCTTYEKLLTVWNKAVFLWYRNLNTLILRIMKANFDLLKNGNVSKTVWANAETQEIYPAHQSSFGHNALMDYRDEFYNKYGHKMSVSWTKGLRPIPCYSAKQMQSAGFRLVKRGDSPLW